MRNRLMIVTAALLLASATLAMAQTEQKKTTPAAPATTEDTTSLGTIDLGFRVTSTTGDLARYERYRDLRNGANINLALGKQTSTHEFSLNGTNLGYKDENINASFANSMFKLTAFFDQTPLNYGLKDMTTTPWTESSKGVWTLDSAARGAVEAKTAVGVLCAPGLAATATCTGLTAPTVLGYSSIYRNLAKGFDITAQRNTFGFGLDMAATKDVDFDVTFQSSSKSGNQPYGMSFAFVNANELPMSLDNRTNDFGLGMSWGSDHGMVRLAYERSVFTQNIPSITWDNPIRLTDWNDGQPIDMTGNGPWDPSAYSNGNGPARGRMAMAPSNTLDLLSATGVAKMPGHSTLNASLALTTTSQNDAFIPWTINPVIATSATYAFFPGLASLPRASAQAKMDGILATVNFTMRPAPWVGLNARYRYSDRKDRMPTFASDSTVRFDGVPEGGIVLAAPYQTEELSASRSVFNADATFSPIPFTQLKLGVGHDKYEHTARAYAALTETTIRASLDSVGNQYFQLRGIFERSRRVGEGFNEEAITGAGAQSALRIYDDAERTRDRNTLLVIVTPVASVDFTASYAAGRDNYDSAEQIYGLLNNKNTTFNVGVNFAPTTMVAIGANYGQDKFNSLQQSKTANPFSGVAGAYESWLDGNRDWTMTNNEKVNNVDLYVDLLKAIPNMDLRFAYTYSDSNNGFLFGGPRITALVNNSIITVGDTKPCATGLAACFEQLPNVTNKWQRLTADAKFFVNKRVDLGVSYWYEKLDISDFATVNNADGTPRIDYLGGLTTGYANRPYKGNTFFGRLIIKM